MRAGIVCICFFLLGHLVSAQQLFIRSTGPYYSELNSSFVQFGDTTLFQYAVVHNQEPFEYYASYFVWMNKAGTILKQQEVLYEPHDSGLYFYRLLDNGKGQCVGFGISSTWNLEMLTLSSDLAIQSVVSIPLDSGSTIGTIKRCKRKYIINTLSSVGDSRFFIYDIDSQHIE